MGSDLGSGSGLQCDDGSQCATGERCLARETTNFDNQYTTPWQEPQYDCSSCGCNSSCLPLSSDPQPDFQDVFSYDNISWTDDTLVHRIESGAGSGRPGDYKVRHKVVNDIWIDPISTHHKLAVAEQEGDREWMSLIKHEPNPVEKLIHISEIDSISFNMGTPVYEEAFYVRDAAGNYTVPGQGPVSGLQDAWLYGSSGFNSGPIPNLESSGQLWKTSYGTQSSETWDFNDLAFNSDDRTAAYAYAYGAWCDDEDGSETGLCASGGDVVASDEDIEDMDIVYVKGVTSSDAHTRLLDDPRIFSPNGAVQSVSGSIVNRDANGDPQPYNPFADLPILHPDSGIWDVKSGFISRAFTSSNGDSNWSLYGEGGVYSLFGDPQDDPDTLLDDSFPDGFFPRSFGHADTSGANMVAVKFDFEDGYLDAVYTIYFNGMSRIDVKKFEDTEWTFFLREPCLLAVEGAVANENGVIASPWQTRVSPNSDYSLFELGYTFSTVNDSDSTIGLGYGPIGNDDNFPISEPDELDWRRKHRRSQYHIRTR